MDKSFFDAIRDEGAFAAFKATLDNGETIYATMDKCGHTIEKQSDGKWATGHRFISEVKFTVNGSIDITETFWNFEASNRFFKYPNGGRLALDDFKKAITNEDGDIEMQLVVVTHHSAEIDGIRYYPITKDTYKVLDFEVIDYNLEM